MATAGKTTAAITMVAITTGESEPYNFVGLHRAGAPFHVIRSAGRPRSGVSHRIETKQERTRWTVTDMKYFFKLLALAAIPMLGLVACGPSSNFPGRTGEATLPPHTILEVLADCTDPATNSLAESITETYDVTYEQVMSWYCDGHSFEDILTALETSQAVDVPAQDLLDMLADRDWNAIWQEVGFTPKQ
jgi:hypothetical protein